MKGFRFAVLGLAAAGMLAIAPIAFAASKATQYYAYQLTKKATCKNTGITGPTGKVELFVYALKGKHPSRSAVSCSRAIAVGTAGKKYMFANLRRSYGKTFKVKGTTYKVEEFISVGASGPAPGFVGDNTVVAASYASGR